MSNALDNVQGILPWLETREEDFVIQLFGESLPEAIWPACCFDRMRESLKTNVE
jgi:hypothetical protein